VKNDIRYAYGFSVEKSLIKEEYLYYFPKGRQVKIFEREGMEIKSGDRYKNAFEVSFTVLKENRLFLSCAANYSNVKEVEAAFIFFNTDIVVYNPEINNWTEYSVELMEKDEKVRKQFVEILQGLGTGIKDVKVRLDKSKLKDLSEDVQVPDAIKMLLDKTKVNAKVIYDDFETDLMTEESTGIKKLFEVICPILDILDKGKVLICDEFERGIHEKVVAEIVKLFQNAQKDKFAQLILSTYDTSLLDSDLFRRDQIWFTQLNAERATDLYSLAEIRNVRKTENLKKGYIAGKYGAIPMLNQAFLEGVQR